MTKNPPSLQAKLNIERNEEVKRMYKRLGEYGHRFNEMQKQIDIMKAEIQGIKLGVKD